MLLDEAYAKGRLCMEVPRMLLDVSMSCRSTQQIVADHAAAIGQAAEDKKVNERLMANMKKETERKEREAGDLKKRLQEEERRAAEAAAATAKAKAEAEAAARRQRQAAAAAEEASATKKKELSAEEQKKQNQALYDAWGNGEMGKLEAAIAAGAEVDWHNPRNVSELSELE